MDFVQPKKDLILENAGKDELEMKRGWIQRLQDTITRSTCSLICFSLASISSTEGLQEGGQSGSLVSNATRASVFPQVSTSAPMPVHDDRLSHIAITIGCPGELLPLPSHGMCRVTSEPEGKDAHL